MFQYQRRQVGPRIEEICLPGEKCAEKTQRPSRGQRPKRRESRSKVPGMARRRITSPPREASCSVARHLRHRTVESLPKQAGVNHRQRSRPPFPTITESASRRLAPRARTRSSPAGEISDPRSVSGLSNDRSRLPSRCPSTSVTQRNRLGPLIDGTEAPVLKHRSRRRPGVVGDHSPRKTLEGSVGSEKPARQTVSLAAPGGLQGSRTGPVGLVQQNDVISEANGFVDIVGHKDDGLVESFLDGEELTLQSEPGHRIHSAKRLIKEKQRRIGRECSGDADALGLAA